MSKSTRGIRVAGIASLAVSLSIGVAAPAFAVADFKFDRIGGADRYETSTLVDDEFRDGGADVILANGQPGNYADALSANTLAGEKNIPILLTRKDETPTSVLQQLKDDAVKNIWVVGGTSVVSDAQVASLKAAGYTVTRVSGADRFGTNNEIIKMSGAAAGNTGLVATGFNFPDALAAGPFSFQGHPLALSTKDSIEDSTIQALKDAGVTKVLIFGGTTVVTPAVEAKLKAAGIDTAARFAGADRSDTSEQAAEYAVKNLGFTNTHVGVASGYVKGYGADALAGGPLEGKEKSPMLVTRDVDNPDDVLDYLKAHSATLKTGHIYGGTAAVSAAAQAAMEKAAQGTAPASTTQLPELVSAKIGETVTTTGSSASKPAGTRVTYTFDEDVTGAAPDASKFKVYSWNDVPHTSATSPVVSADGRSVTVNFTDITTAAGAADLTVATVAANAVTDGSGKKNPEGDAAIGAARTDTGGAAGVTAAPDLLSVGNFREGTAAGTTLVDFTFDEAANPESTSGYHLVYKDGTDNASGVGPAADSTTPPSGQNTPGGGGTTKITVLFTTAGMTPAQVQAATSRGTIDQGTVSDVDNNTLTNPLEAADLNNSGNTDEPDLVSASLQPGATTSAVDKVLYTFDEPVQVAPDKAKFGVYNASGVETYGTATDAARNPSNSSQVLVTFPAGNLIDAAVGAIVRDAAVTASTGAGTAANEQDEVGVSNPTSTQITPGKTTAPDLTGVALAIGKDTFGNPTGYEVTFTFDEAVDSVTAGSLKLYQADGTRIDLTGCTIVLDANNVKTNQVHCTGGATSVTMGSAVLGTVLQDGVKDASTQGSPEGAEPTTGGTGTPSA